MKTENKRQIRILDDAPFHWVGDGFPVKSLLNYRDHAEEVSPFLLLDYASPYPFTPGYKKRGVGVHPHRGFETVTIVYQGELAHRDSSGAGGVISSGDVQWMTAGAGILHEEFHSDAFTESGGTFEVVQLWINLPKANKSAKPGYQSLLKDNIPTVALPNSSGNLRVISGEYKSTVGPARTFTPVNLWDVYLNPGSELQLDLPVGHSKTILVRQGSVKINGESLKESNIAVLDRALAQVTLSSTTNAKLLVMTGSPINEPVVGHGPFVMNTEAEIQQAFSDFKSGKFGSPGDF